MIIGIDANEANIKKRAGIGRYALNVLNGIYSVNNKSKIPDNFQIYLKSNPLAELPNASPFWQYKKISPRFFWSQIALPYYLNKLKDKPKVLFSQSHYSPKFSGIASVISVMDLSYLHYPEMFKSSDLYKLKNWTAMSVKKAKKIITISQFTKGEIMKYYSVSPDRIIVAYPAVDHKIYKPKNEFGKKNTILYVGTLQPRKNIKGLIKAFSMLKNKDNLRLVIVGQKGWLFEDIFPEVKEIGLESKVFFRNYVSEQDLISLYQNALCLVLPSFYEGFGIPVIEAMSCGCPVIVSNSSSLPEIAGNAGIFINPKDPSTIKDAIDKVYKDGKLRNTLIKKGLARSKSFNWENTSRIIYTTLTETAKIG